VEHPLLDKLSFTGSSATGKALLHASAERLRPTSLELGGKGAMIVFDDADLDGAIDWTMVGIFLTTGQVCSATSRLLVQESIAPQFIERLVEATNTRVHVGDPLEDGTSKKPARVCCTVRCVVCGA
jgi:betaine-aldehyde dehydrogenase